MKVLVVRDMFKNTVFKVAFADTFLASFDTALPLAVKNKQLEQIALHLYHQVKGVAPLPKIVVTESRPAKQANHTKIAFELNGTKRAYSFILEDDTLPVHSFQHLELLDPFSREQGRLVGILESGLLSEFDHLVSEKSKCLDLLGELESQLESLPFDARGRLTKFIAKQRVVINDLLLLTNDNDCDDEAIKKCLLQANIDSYAKKAILVSLYNVATQLYYDYVARTEMNDKKREAFIQYFLPFGFVNDYNEFLSFDQVRGNRAALEPETVFQKLISGQRLNSNFINFVNSLLAKIDSINWASSWIFSTQIRPIIKEALAEAIHNVNARLKAYAAVCPFGITEDTQELIERKRQTTHVLNEADIKKRFAQIKLAFAECREKCNGELLAILRSKSMPSSSASSLASSSSSVTVKDEFVTPLSQSPVSTSLSSSSDTVESCPISLSESLGSSDEDFMDNFKLHFLASTWAKKGGFGLDLVIANESNDASLPDSIKKIKAVLVNFPVEQQWGAIKQIAQQANVKDSPRRCPTTSAYLNLLAGNDDEIIQDYFKQQANILRDGEALRGLLQQIKQVIEQRDWMKLAGSFYPIQVDTDNGVQEKYVPKHIAMQHGILREYFANTQAVTDVDSLSVFQQIEKIGLKASHNTHRYRHEHVSNFYSIFSQSKANLPALLADQQDYIKRNQDCFNELIALHGYIKQMTWEVHSWRSAVRNFLNGDQNLNQGDRFVCLNSNGMDGVERKPDFLPSGVKEQYLLIEALIDNKSKYDALTVFAKVQEIARKANQNMNKYRLVATSNFYNRLSAAQTPQDIHANIITI